MKTTKAIFRIATSTFALTGRICPSSLVPLLLLLLMLPVWGAQAAVVFTTLYSFTGTNDGSGPNGLVQGRDGNFYGTTGGGGTNNSGTVFKLSTNGALTSLYSFTGTNDGSGPNALVQGSDGNFYGTTWGGSTYGSGYNGYGTVFKISADGALTTLYAFGSITNASGEALDGANPYASLVQGSDGNFYGTTQSGGTSNLGTVFQISTNGALTALHSFVGTDGSYPRAALVQGTDGYFYGTIHVANNMFGSELDDIFKISTNGALTALDSGISHLDTVDGLVQGSDGYFYGTTYAHVTWFDGLINGGTIFKISANGALTSLYSFTGTNNDGANPGGLVQGSDGNF